MRTKHLCVLIHIRTKGEDGTVNMFKPSSDFTDHSRAVLFVNCVSCLSLLCCLVCSLQPSDHLLGNGCTIDSPVCCVFLCFCHSTIWYSGSGVVLDCRFLIFAFLSTFL